MTDSDVRAPQAQTLAERVFAAGKVLRNGGLLASAGACFSAARALSERDERSQPAGWGIEASYSEGEWTLCDLLFSNREDAERYIEVYAHRPARVVPLRRCRLDTA